MEWICAKSNTPTILFFERKLEPTHLKLRQGLQCTAHPTFKSFFGTKTDRSSAQFLLNLSLYFIVRRVCRQQESKAFFVFWRPFQKHQGVEREKNRSRRHSSELIATFAHPIAEWFADYEKPRPSQQNIVNDFFLLNDNLSIARNSRQNPYILIWLGAGRRTAGGRESVKLHRTFSHTS